MSTFKILIDRLREGAVEPIDEKADPSFLHLEEPELSFKDPVSVKGEAYLTDSHLIIRLKGNTKARMPCAVCNQMIEVELKADDFYHAEPIEEIKSAVFDYSEALREALLIELPRTVECKGGKCPERGAIAPYMSCRDQTHFPFADL